MKVFAASPGGFGVDLRGRPVEQLAETGTRLVVLVFAASDCPISNRYVPEIARLSKEFAGEGVRFWWVFPNPDDNATVVARHNRDFSITETAEVGTLIDAQQKTVRLAHVTTTPEAAVFVAEGRELREVYHGRIDDRYISLGQERPQPQHHDLESALAAAVAGNAVAPPGGPPVGCSIVYLQK
jgi:thiol-disulfide isomerase/thioredoxin